MLIKISRKTYYIIMDIEKIKIIEVMYEKFKVVILSDEIICESLDYDVDDIYILDSSDLIVFGDYDLSEDYEEFKNLQKEI
jgi:hypothetical protein